MKMSGTSKDMNGSSATTATRATASNGALNQNNNNNNSSRTVAKESGFTLRWSRLVKTVEVREATAGLLRSSIAVPTTASTDSVRKQGAVTKIILNQVSGCAEPGQVVALMGPSGSGKTTLLNTLSGRSSYESGVISINGEPITSNSMKRLMSKIAYVKQADIFFDHLTVRDQLTYTALLRLPADMSTAAKHAEVNRILNLLRLNKVSDAPIKLLSGGEKKRVNIGTELLTNPQVLLCDEPISGLDSTTAVSLLKVLRNLAREYGKTVVTSIHQPSSPVFRSFDRLVMLAEGHVVYFGTPSDSLVYLRNKSLPCPDGYNAADHWMDLLVHDTIESKDDFDAGSHNSTDIGTTQHSMDGNDNVPPRSSDGQLSDVTPRQQLIDAWDSEAVAEQLDLALVKDTSSSSSDGPSSALVHGAKYNTTWMTQFRVLMHRSLKNSRSAIFTPINLIKSAVLGIVAGLLWFQLDYTERTIKDRSSYYFFTMTYWVFDSMFGALLSFPSERVVILKERASASYHLSAYFLAKTISEAPVRLILPVIYMVISYWMAGISPRFTVFLFSVGCTLLSVLAGEAFGLFVGASIYDMEKAITTMTVVALGMMLLGGFYVSNTPSWVSWAKYLSPFKYAFDASRQLVFDHPVPCDGSGVLETFCSVPGTKEVSAADVIKFLGVNGSVGFNCGLLVVLIFIPRYIAYWALRSKKADDRS